MHINTLKCQQSVRETRQRQWPMPLPRSILRCRGNYAVAGEPSRKKMHRMQHHMGNKNDKEGTPRQRTKFCGAKPTSAFEAPLGMVTGGAKPDEVTSSSFAFISAPGLHSTTEKGFAQNALGPTVKRVSRQRRQQKFVSRQKRQRNGFRAKSDGAMVAKCLSNHLLTFWNSLVVRS